MSTLTQPTTGVPVGRAVPAAPATVRDRARRRALWVTSGLTILAVGLLADLLLVGHTNGEEIWGPITAGLAALTGALSLAILARRGRNRAARYAVIALWLTVAFFGFGGYNSHRLPAPDGTVDPRPRPPLAPLMFTGMGIAGAVVLRSGTKGNEQ
jgi:hypothetical protein